MPSSGPMRPDPAFGDTEFSVLLLALWDTPHDGLCGLLRGSPSHR